MANLHPVPPLCDDEQAAFHDWLLALLTPERVRRFHEVLDWRTRWIEVVICDIYQQHNASAVLRTCDAFGVQNVSIIEEAHECAVNPEIALGAERWLTLRHDASPRALENTLAAHRAAGRRIVATVLDERSLTPDELPLDRPVALLFGTEKTGLPRAAIDQADALLRIPMYGFAESFNVSVAAALCLQTLIGRLHASELPWQLTASEREQLLRDWVRRSTPKVDLLLRRFQQERAAGRVRSLPRSAD